MPKKEHLSTFKKSKLFPGKQLQMEQSKKLMLPVYLGCISKFLVQDEKGFPIIVKSLEFWSNYSREIRWGNIPRIR